MHWLRAWGTILNILQDNGWIFYISAHNKSFISHRFCQILSQFLCLILFQPLPYIPIKDWINFTSNFIPIILYRLLYQIPVGGIRLTITVFFSFIILNDLPYILYLPGCLLILRNKPSIKSHKLCFSEVHKLILLHHIAQTFKYLVMFVNKVLIVVKYDLSIFLDSRICICFRVFIFVKSIYLIKNCRF